MHFVYEKTDLHLHRFLEKIGPRPQTWRVMSIEFQDGETVRSPFFQDVCRNNIHTYFKDTDTRIFWHKPGFILIIFQGRVAPIEDCVESFLKEMEFKGVKRFFDILDLSIHWKHLIKLLDLITLPQATALEPKGEGLTIKPNAVTPDEFKISISPDIINHLKIPRQTRARPVLLLVEDNPVVLQVAKAVVEKHFDVVMAETVRQAIVYYQRHLPDMVFLDIQLPDGNGVELLKDILDVDNDAYVIMLSGETQKSKIIETLEMGAKSYIPKPFNEQDLLDAINEYLYQKDELMEKSRSQT